MQLFVQVQQKAVADFVAGKSQRPEMAELIREAREAGVVFEPMHPRATDPESQSWFQAHVPEGADARAIASRLLAHESVLAAYPKPQDEPP